MFVRASQGGGGGSAVISGTASDITSAQGTTTIATGISNVKRLIVRAEIAEGSAYLVWDSESQGFSDTMCVTFIIYAGTTMYQGVRQVGTAQGWLSLMSVDAANGTFELKGGTLTYMPVTNIVWYAE